MMSKQDMKYRNRVLRNQAVKQQKQLSRLLFNRLLNALEYQVTSQDHTTEWDLINTTQNIITPDLDKSIENIRKKNDKTKKYAYNVAKELRRMKNKETKKRRVS